MSQVILDFKFTDINDEYMTLTIGGQPVEPGLDNRARVVVNIEFPTSIELVVGGKDMTRDTVLDSNGVIIRDKHILLERVTVDRMLVRDYFLKTWPQTPDRATNYFGFNGPVVLNFLERDSFVWLLKTK